MPRRIYRDVDECRPAIRRRARNIRNSSDDDDDEARDVGSGKAYIKDLRWFDEWLDTVPVDPEDDILLDDDDVDVEVGLDRVRDLTVDHVELLGFNLVEEFNGTTPGNRWRSIYNMYDRLWRRGKIDENPLERWNDIKDDHFNITNSTEQEKHLEDGEDYAPSQEEIRLMEQNVGAPRLRNQCLIRFISHTGLRRGEASFLTTDDIDLDSREVVVRKEIAKNGERRTVVWQSSLDALMKEWIEVQRAAFTNGDKSNKWLWVNRGGGRLRADGINDVVVKAAYNAEDPETGEPLNRPLYADANAPLDDDGNPIPNRHKISAHNLRVSLGTYLANETDMGIYEVSKALGHQSVSVTEEKYIDDDDRVAVKPMRKFASDL